MSSLFILLRNETKYNIFSIQIQTNVLQVIIQKTVPITVSSFLHIHIAGDLNTYKHFSYVFTPPCAVTIVLYLWVVSRMNKKEILVQVSRFWSKVYLTKIYGYMDSNNMMLYNSSGRRCINVFQLCLYPSVHFNFCSNVY